MPRVRPSAQVRDQYFYLGQNVLQTLPQAANFVVSTFVIVEMAEAGNEGLIYGLLTTTYNLGHPVATAVGNQLFSLFKPALSNSANYVADTPEFRNTVAASFAVSYVFSFAALLLLPLLPGQKDEAQRRKRAWPQSTTYAVVTLALLGCGFCYSLTVNTLAMVPETMCLRFVGGEGCKPGTWSRRGLLEATRRARSRALTCMHS